MARFIPSNNQVTVITGPVEEAIFADGFESGGLSAWSARSARGPRIGAPASVFLDSFASWRPP